MDKKDVCGAKTKKGTPCQAPALENGRCRIHGGLTTPNKDKITRPMKSLARGFYTDCLFPWEEDQFAACQIGTLEEEIKLLRIQLRRALIAQRNYQIVMDELGEFREDPDSCDIPSKLLGMVEIESYEYTKKENQKEGEEEIRKMLRRKRDYRREIAQWTKLIGQLECFHKELLKDDLFTGDTLAKMAEDLREFSSNAFKTIGKDGN